MPKNLKPLRRLLEIEALCYYVGEKLQYNADNCDNTFRYVREYCQQYDADAGQVIAELERLGAHCDCETGFNICGEL